MEERSNIPAIPVGLTPGLKRRGVSQSDLLPLSSPPHKANQALCSSRLSVLESGTVVIWNKDIDFSFDPSYSNLSKHIFDIGSYI